MKANFHESLEETPVALPSDRSTGLVLSTAAGIAALLVWRSAPGVAAAAGALAAGLGLASIAAPHVLRPLNIAWMALGRLLGRVVSPLVMLLMYVLAIIPFGLAMQLRADPLRRRPTTQDETYWIVPEIEFGPKDMTRQF
jgi:hypothetical protein